MKKIPALQQSYIFDSLSVVPGSFQMPGIAQTSYRLEEVSASLTWLNKNHPDSVLIIYRVFPFNWSTSYSHFKYDSIRYNFLSDPIEIPLGRQNNNTFLDLGTIQSTGSIGRSLSFGNAQDAVVNSNLNLQLHGFIADSLEITAAISDNNIPIQPNGNTRNVRDLDRIYLQAKKDNWQMEMGDLELKFDKGYFLNFYKRLQGGHFSSIQQLSAKATNHFSITGAIAKGKYFRNILDPQEGNQGPYKLLGTGNSLYFIILSGTERVYMDGELLERGEDADYTINYNTAEISFTPKHIIQKDKRIQVEFEYAERNYLNSQIFITNQIILNDKLSIRVSGYSNVDAKRSPIDQQLSAQQQLMLSGLGDSLGNAYYLNALQAEYSPGKLLYKKIDTLYAPNLRDSIFVLSADTGSLLYDVSFTYLGPGKGNYLVLNNGTNGKAFQWVAPAIDGKMKGDWQPVSLLVAPAAQQLISLHLQQKLSKTADWGGEWTGSRRDVNLFSAKDKQNDFGYAARVYLNLELGKLKWKKNEYSFQTRFVAEKRDSAFNPIERIRTIEFYRDWSLATVSLSENENLIGLSLQMSGNKSEKVKYEGNWFEHGRYYSGLKNVLDANIPLGNWRFIQKINNLQYKDQSRSGSYVRPGTEVMRSFPRLNNAICSFKYTGEYNTSRLTGLDSLFATSFGFDVYDLSVRSGKEKSNKWTLNYFRRQDRLPSGRQLLLADLSDNFSIGLELLQNSQHQFRLNMGYRAMKIIRQDLSKRKKDENLVGRLEDHFRILNGFVNGSIFYETGSGQELKRDFSYVAVPPGQGQYMWVDYNQNGIEELNEFEEAVFQDQKKYIRVFTPGTSYVKLNYFQLNYSVDISPKLLMKKKKVGVGLLRKMDFNSSMQLNRKLISGNDLLVNPFEKNIADSSIIGISRFMSNGIFVNRTDPNWSLEVIQQYATNRGLYVYGLETSTNKQYSMRARKRLAKGWQVGFQIKQQENALQTTGVGFTNRNYQLMQKMMEPSLSYNYKTIFRCQLGYSMSQKNNLMDSLDKAVLHELKLDVRYSLQAGSSLQIKLSMNDIKWGNPSGYVNNTVGFIMLNGLLPGKNYLWTVDLNRRLGRGMELNLQYEGRQPAGSTMIHIGRAGVRALF